MSNLTYSKVHKSEPRAGRKAYTAANGITFYGGGLVGLNAAGYLAKWADTAGHTFLGLLLAPVVGDTSATLPPEGRVDISGITLRSATVASVARTDENALVYCTTDNPADFTLTPGSTLLSSPVGYVARFVSSGVADVTLFTPEEAMNKKNGIVALTDSSGGSPSNTIAAIGGTYSQSEVRDAIASLAAKINALRAV